MQIEGESIAHIHTTTGESARRLPERAGLYSADMRRSHAAASVLRAVEHRAARTEAPRGMTGGMREDGTAPV